MSSDNENSLGKCPICGENENGEIIEKQNSFACTEAKWSNEGTEGEPKWKNSGCNYSINKAALIKHGGPTISAEDAKKIIAKESIKVDFQMSRDVIFDSNYGIKVLFFQN